MDYFKLPRFVLLDTVGLGAFFGSRFLVISATTTTVVGIGIFGSDFLPLCRAIFPSSASMAQGILATLSLKMKGGRTSRLIDTDELMSNAKALKSKLNEKDGGRFMDKSHASVVQAKKIVDNMTTIAKYFRDVLGKTNTPALVLIAAQHTPVISVAFAVLEPVLLKFAEVKKTDDLVVRTSNRITGLLEEIKATIKQADKDKVELTQDEVSDVNSLLLIIEEGLELVGKIMGERKKSWRNKLWRTITHREKLESWLEVTNEFVKKTERKKSSVSHIRIRDIFEKQRQYFAFLTYSSLLHSILLVGLTYAVFFIIIPLLSKDSLPVAIFKWAKDSGKMIWKSGLGL